ncbi:pentapeptide repeat-containing protein [Streptomyces sp. NPDC057620]|uniref:pentapeptide repeat-containing protein n=1 Tax=Streptomyces sp. NPDC057620 TaxID=3346185 RepID=UPI003688C779
MFTEAMFLSNSVDFMRAVFSRRAIFRRARFAGDPLFMDATFGYSDFSEAVFSGRVDFRRAKFSLGASFEAAKFTADASFNGATFRSGASFDTSIFSERADFGASTIHGGTEMPGGGVLSDDEDIRGATFAADAWFDEVKFSGATSFNGVVFSANATFERAVFEVASQLGPLVCRGVLALSGGRFVNPVTIEAATNRLVCRRTRWDATAALRLRYATVDFSDAVFEYPLSITAQAPPWRSEDALVGGYSGVQMASLRGADASHLVLHNIDLTACTLSGTLRLDQLRLEGECPLAPAPSGLRWRGPLPVRWTARRTLAEEHHWRAAQGRTGWQEAPAGAEVVGPAVLAPVYRQLRQSFEDGKNEPDAADFYYGEMEMRRHDTKRPRAERTLLALYWAVSGYGLRASRALGWLLVAMSATVLVMMLWGIPTGDPKPATTGRLTGQSISLTTDKPDPVNPTGSLRSRLTTERLEKSLRVVVNSVVFRSSGQDLTVTGTYAEMASRLTEPVLLGLAALAIRGRVKR